MKYNKGLSTVVTTLIIVLLVLAAVGIIWGPIKNLLSNSTSSLDQTKCLNLGFKIVRINETSAGNYSVTLQRLSTGTGTNEIGAKVIFYSDTNSSQAIDLESDKTLDMFTPLRIQTANLNPGFSATSLDVIPYYIDASNGEKKVCNTPTKFTIVAS